MHPYKPLSHRSNIHQQLLSSIIHSSVHPPSSVNVFHHNNTVFHHWSSASIILSLVWTTNGLLMSVIKLNEITNKPESKAWDVTEISLSWVLCVVEVCLQGDFSPPVTINSPYSPWGRYNYIKSTQTGGGAALFLNKPIRGSLMFALWRVWSYFSAVISLFLLKSSV